MVTVSGMARNAAEESRVTKLVIATNSFNSNVSRFVTGSPTDQAVWTLIGGIMVAVVGLAMSVRVAKQG